MIDFANPAALAAARATAQNINKAHGIADLMTRRTSVLREAHMHEALYRNAENVVDQDVRRIRQAEAAMKEAEEALLIAATEVLGDDGKPKFKNESTRKAAIVWSRRNDPDFLAAKGALDVAEHTSAISKQMLADAKVAYNGALREFAMLTEEFRLATARINALGGLDAAP